jgi:hypothetical protein
MMDGIISQLQHEIETRTAEVMHSGQAGFTPENVDVRGPVRTRPTFDPMTVAAPGDAQFILYDALGRRSFSRDGAFIIEDGIVKSRDGKSVVGYASDSRETSELCIDQHDLALGRVQNLHIEADGAVTYRRVSVDPQTMQTRSESVQVGTLALARFPAGTQLVHSTAGDRAPLGLEPYIGRAGDGNFTLLKPGRVDVGRLDLNRALGRIHDLYTQLEAMCAAGQARAGTDKTATDLVK